MATKFALLSLALVSLCTADPNEKRGLCFVDSKHTSDYQIWTQRDSDLTWYYNYSPLPAPAYSKLDQEQFEFVPMMWGVGANPDDTTFLSQVKNLIKGGRNVTHVLGFNEPNAQADWGGSNVTPEVAARAWVANFEPLGKMGVKLGLPGCMGSWDALPWLSQFVGNCSKIVSGSGPKKNCTWDFLPVHWYDNFGGLQSHINERRVAYVSHSLISRTPGLTTHTQPPRDRNLDHRIRLCPPRSRRQQAISRPDPRVVRQDALHRPLHLLWRLPLRRLQRRAQRAVSRSERQAHGDWAVVSRD